MALSFMPSSSMTLDVVVTCDPAVNATPEQAERYLDTGDIKVLDPHAGATIFTRKALSAIEREEAEVRAGAYTRSELGRHLWIKEPMTPEARAQWHHALALDEREALGEYKAYLNRVFVEMVKSALTAVDGVGVSAQSGSHPLELIRPESHRVQVIAELVRHVQRMSLLSPSGK
jgi:hypothetical protein